MVEHRSSRPGSLPTENEEQVRNLKASESVVAAFRSAGFPSAPRDLSAIITTFVSNSTRGIPFGKISNMTPSDGQLASFATMGVNSLIESMSPVQREAMRAGVNPLDPAAVLQFSDKLHKLAPQQATQTLSSMRSGDNSARYDQVGDTASRGDWSSPSGQTYMRGYAIQHGLPWAANNADLLRLGPTAIDSIAQAHLRSEIYSGLNQTAGFTAKNVVTMTDYANRTATDANKLGKAITDANDGLSPEEKKLHNGALLKFMDAKDAPDREPASTKLHDAQKKLEETHPEKAETFKKLDKLLEEKKAEKRAENSAGSAIGAKAAAKENSNDDARAQMAEILRKRQGASATPKSGS
jgi:hypothetical protein